MQPTTDNILQLRFVDSSTGYLKSFSSNLKITSCDLLLPVIHYPAEPHGERLLIIFSHATEDDMRSRKLGDSPQGALVNRLLTHLREENRKGIRQNLPSVKDLSFINFRDRAFEQLKQIGSDYETPYCKAWVERIIAYVEEFQPTRILISGEGAFQAILYHSQPQIEGHQDFNTKSELKEPYLHVGRIYDFQYNGKTIPTSFTIPLHWTTTSNPGQMHEASSLIHQQKFHLEHLLYGYNLYSITDSTLWIRKDIMNLEEFESFYAELLKAPKVCIDLETDNLSRFANKILTAHFSLDGNTAYNLPLCHRETPFSASEIEIIQNKLKAYFQDHKTVLHVYHNAKFDIGVLTAQLNLTYYNHRVYDTIGGTFCLDENVRAYNVFQTPAYNLRRLAYQYGCSVYDEGEIGKEDRSNMANTPLDHIFEYASKDVIIPYQIHEFQVKEALRRNYTFWEEFVIEQIGAMTLVFVGMENKGILIDKKYLIDLCSNDGIVNQQLEEVVKQFKASVAAQEVNHILVVYRDVQTYLKSAKTSLRTNVATIRKSLTKISKPKRLLKKFSADPVYVESLNLRNHYHTTLAEKETEFKALGDKLFESLNVLYKFIEEDVYNLRRYNQQVTQLDLSTHMQQFITFIQQYFINFCEDALTKNLYTSPSNDLVIPSPGEDVTPLVADKEKQPLEAILELCIALINSLNTWYAEVPNLVKLYQNKPVDIEKDWLFDIGELKSQQLLFFDVLRLEPVSRRKDGGGTVAKEFQEMYESVPEVSYLTTYNKYKKLMSTYIEGMLSRLEADADSQLDGRLRASYGYRDVLTGRSSSRDPNFQNLPSRGSLAKTIKDQFVAGKGEIYIKADYNAAEVRQWANVSGDVKLAETFRKGMIMRRELFLEQEPTKRQELKAKIKGEGDVHRLNYSFFFGKEAKDVTEEERTSVKAVIFGVMYGKSSFTLAKDLNISEAQATMLLKKLFDTYKVAGDWIESTKAKASSETLVARSPIGRIRHLASLLHQNREVISSSERKICNSITQGFSSDMGYAGGRLLQQVVYKGFQQAGYNLHLFQNNTVHDSVEAITKFEHLPLSIYLVEQAYTTLMHLKYKHIFKMDWKIESEMDFELGCTVGSVKKFDWWELPNILEEALNYSQEKLGYTYTPEELNEIRSKFHHNYEGVSKLKTFETKRYLEFIKENPGQVYLDSVLLNKNKFDTFKSYLRY